MIQWQTCRYICTIWFPRENNAWTMYSPKRVIYSINISFFTRIVFCYVRYDVPYRSWRYQLSGRNRHVMKNQYSLSMKFSLVIIIFFFLRDHKFKYVVRPKRKSKKYKKKKKYQGVVKMWSQSENPNNESFLKLIPDFSVSLCYKYTRTKPCSWQRSRGSIFFCFIFTL